MYKQGVILLTLLFAATQVSFGQEESLSSYSVYFHSETSILMAESEEQLQELLQMLNENPNTRIKLHGHTNGDPSGSYTRLGENDTVFFKLASSHELTSGSAKNLSYDRALTVKLYLVWKGIAPDRIKVKGWGGKKQLYAESSRFVQKNRRVEVEVLAE